MRIRQSLYDWPVADAISLVMLENWDEPVREALEQGLRQWSRAKAGSLVAAFDWDETVIRHDIGDALFNYQVDNLCFTFNHPDFWGLIPEPERSAWQATLKPLRGLSLAEAKRHPAYSAHRLYAQRAYHHQWGRPIEDGYPWCTQVLVGLTLPEVYRMTQAAWAEGRASRLGRYTLGNDDGGPVITIRTGLRWHRAMVRLIRVLQRIGVEVWVVTATNRWSVAHLAAKIGIPFEQVIGVETTQEDGRLTTQVVRPAPAGPGKAETLKAALRPDQQVVLAAGDNLTDWDLLTLASDVRLVVAGRTPALVDAAESAGPPWVAQKKLRTV